MTAKARNEREHWAADKRISVALVFAILVQSGATVWWASDLHRSQSSRYREFNRMVASRALRAARSSVGMSSSFASISGAYRSTASRSLRITA